MPFQFQHGAIKRIVRIKEFGQGNPNFNSNMVRLKDYYRKGAGGV